MKGKYLGLLLIFVVITLAVVFKTTADYKQTNNELEMKLETITELEEKLKTMTTVRNDELASFNELETRYKLEQETSAETYENIIMDLELLLTEGNNKLSELMLPDESSRYMLEEMGVYDPAVLIDDLIDLGEDIISYKGVLGGTMHFYNVKILNDKWAFARFEDGHYGGYGIYEFDLDNDQITWKVVVEYRDN